MRIYFASDHAGFELKGKLVNFVRELGYEVNDLGPSTFNPEDDYPIYIARAAEMVSENPDNARGIIIGASGQGEDMVADKFPNVRSAEYYGGELEIVELSREHNNANILSLAARFLSENEAKEAVKLWLETPFSEEERHKRRLEEIEKLEEQLHKNP